MRSYLRLSGAILGLIALAQALRLVVQWPVTVGTFLVPLWPSVIAMLIAGSLSIWAFRLLARLEAAVS